MEEDGREDRPRHSGVAVVDREVCKLILFILVVCMIEAVSERKSVLFCLLLLLLSLSLSLLCIAKEAKFSARSVMRCDATRSIWRGGRSLGVWRSRGRFLSLRECPDRGVQPPSSSPPPIGPGGVGGRNEMEVVGVDDGRKDGESDPVQRDGKDFLFLIRLARIPPP